MNTKFIMIASVLFLATLGLGLTFFPIEISNYLNLGFQQFIVITLQLMGGLYFGFAMLNWMAKDGVIGGIYNKPLVTANLSHFMIGGLALLKYLAHDPGKPGILWLLAAIYTIFGIVFGVLFVRTPTK